MSQEEAKLVTYPKGAAIIVQNAPNPGLFFVVKSGRVVVDSQHMLVDHELTFYEAGDSFGLVSAFTEHKFLVSLFADTEVELYQVPIRFLGSHLKESRDIALRILKLYSQELRTLQKHLSKANRPEDRTYHPERLLQNAKVYLKWNRTDLVSYSLRKYVHWYQDLVEKPEDYPEALALLEKLDSDYHPHHWRLGKNEIRKDEVIFLESENSNEIYVILEGKVRLFKIIQGHEYTIDILGPGEIFGEMSLIEHAPRMASAVAETRVRLLRVTADTIFDAVGAPLLQKIFQSIARRIWFSHQRLLILKMKSIETRIYSMLYNMTKDQDIRLSRNTQDNSHRAYTILMPLGELCKMCGLMKTKKEELKEILADQNLSFTTTSIHVKNKRRLEERLSLFKNKETEMGERDSLVPG